MRDHRGNSVAAPVLRIYRTADERWVAEGGGDVDDLRLDYPGRNSGETWWLYAGVLVDRNAGARGCMPGNADEYARLDGVGDPEYWPGYKSHFPGAVFHDGLDGIGDDIYDQSDAAGDLSGQDAWSRTGQGRRATGRGVARTQLCRGL